MSEELKPCPFCKSAAMISRDSFCAQCTVCGCKGPYVTTGPRFAIAAWNRRTPDAQTEPEAPMAVEPTAHTNQWWMHCLDMEKTQAWQQGYAQGLHRATPLQAPCDGGLCGFGGYCDKCPAVPPEPLEWRTFVYNGFIKFDIGNQTFRLAYAADDHLLPSQQAAQLEWLRSMLHAALSRLSATPPQSLQIGERGNEGGPRNE